jgi:hypothetical protein
MVFLAAVILTLMTTPQVSHATVIGVCDTDHAGSCTISVDINPTGTQFTLVLTNTSPSANGGFITGVAFDLPGALSAALVNPTDFAFTLISGAIKVVPITPTREFLLTTDPSPDANNSFEGGGNPQTGIAAGSTLTFIFAITGGLLTDNFVNESFILNSQVVRFRGFGDGGSDKDIALQLSPSFAAIAAIPEAASFLLFGSGLMIFLIRKKSGRR